MSDTKPLNLDEPVMLSDGRPVRIICKDRKSGSGRNIVALITSVTEGYEFSVCFNEEGFSSGRIYKLVNVPPPSRFINLYASTATGGEGHTSLEHTQEMVIRSRLPHWKGTIEETSDGTFVAFHPKPE